MPTGQCMADHPFWIWILAAKERLRRMTVQGLSDRLIALLQHQALVHLMTKNQAVILFPEDLSIQQGLH